VVEEPEGYVELPDPVVEDGEVELPDPVVEDGEVELLPVPEVDEPVLLVPDCPLMLPEVPLVLPLRFRRERDERDVVVLELLFWSMVVAPDCPVCDALDCPVPSVPVALAPEPEL
jgi:hypothetical protein